MRAEIATTFCSKMVAISTRITKIESLRTLYGYIFRMLQIPHFGILLPLKSSCREFYFLPSSKISLKCKLSSNGTRSYSCDKLFPALIRIVILFFCRLYNIIEGHFLCAGAGSSTPGRTRCRRDKYDSIQKSRGPPSEM